jgi:hypothetical protein
MGAQGTDRARTVRDHGLVLHLHHYKTTTTTTQSAPTLLHRSDNRPCLRRLLAVEKALRPARVQSDSAVRDRPADFPHPNKYPQSDPISDAPTLSSALFGEHLVVGRSSHSVTTTIDYVWLQD